jgi:hypothetical protein
VRDISKEALSEIFRRLGARDPEQWAHSQVTEGIPQLLRFLFLKDAWSSVHREGDASWIDREIESAAKDPHAPYAGLGQALARCRAATVSDEDLTEIARCLQAQMIFDIGYLLDGGSLTDIADEAPVTWGLFQTDESDAPFGPAVRGLHESVLEMDPTGREMQPKAGA